MVDTNIDLYNTDNVQITSGIYIFTWIIFALLVYFEFGLIASYISSLLLFVIATICMCHKEKPTEEPPSSASLQPVQVPFVI